MRKGTRHFCWRPWLPSPPLAEQTIAPKADLNMVTLRFQALFVLHLSFTKRCRGSMIDGTIGPMKLRVL